MKKSTRHLLLLAIDAVLIALYVVLNVVFEVPIGNIKFTFGPLPIIFAAFYFGWTHASIIAVLGEMLSQLLTYGVTYTFLLWPIPPLARAIVMCIFISIILKLSKNKRINNFSYMLYFVIIVSSGIITTILNTGVIAVDALIYHYYKYQIVFGSLLVRIVVMLISSVVYTIISKPLIDSLYKIKLLKK